MNRLFHYTCGNRIGQIIDSGEIRPSTATLTPGELPLVWCSTNLFWEPTSAKGLGAVDRRTGAATLLRELTMGEHERYTEGLARVEVKLGAAPSDFREAIAIAHIPPHMVKLLLRKAAACRSRSKEWRASLTAIPATEWLVVEQFDFAAQAWVPLTAVPQQTVYQEQHSGLGACAPMNQLPLSGKEPWMMTSEEYLAHEGINAGAGAIQRAHNRHSEIVYQAIRDGKLPPPEVLFEYPGAALNLNKRLKENGQ